jgi:formylglycine-generating enzyme
MRSHRVLQVGLGVALMAGVISIATAADMPSSDKDMVLIPKGEFTMGSR